MEKNIIEDYMEFTKAATCSYTVVEEITKRLGAQGFARVVPGEDMKIVPGGKYYVKCYESTLIAFTVGTNLEKIVIEASHTDQPGFTIKPSPVIKSENYRKLNVEVYGGPLLNTWLDRPLGIAGIVATKSDDVFRPNLHVFDSKKAVAVIPNLAIHLNREANKGVELNKQKDLLPIFMTDGSQFDNENFTKYLAENLGVESGDILDYTLHLYNCENSVLTGFKNDILMAPRIDNLASVYAGILAIADDSKENSDTLKIEVFFDNEEVGSKTKQGAASLYLLNIIKNIYNSLGYSEFKMLEDMGRGCFLSMDGAHAYHPNYSEKSDPTNIVNINDGIVIKKASNQSYSTDTVSGAVVVGLCKKHNINYKMFANKSDIPGGSTLGSIASTVLPMRMADVGIPMLAMHSAMETMGANDLENLVKLAKVFFNN